MNHFYKLKYDYMIFKRSYYTIKYYKRTEKFHMEIYRVLLSGAFFMLKCDYMIIKRFYFINYDFHN